MKKTILSLLCTLTISAFSFAQDIQQTLIEAVRAKNLDAVKKVVEQLNADVNKPWDNKAVGNPYALNIACMTIEPSVEIVKYLLDKGAKLDVEDKFGVTPLISLFQSFDTKNRLEILNLLIDKGADINAQSRGGGSALGYACERYQLECVKLLIEKGADVNGRKNNFANTPLMYAVSTFDSLTNNKDRTLIDLLLASGADPKEERKVSAGAGLFENKTAADLANEKGFTELAIYLKNAKKVKVKK